MNDSFVGRESIEIEVSPGAIDNEAISPGGIPTDAFSFQNIEDTSTPILTIVSPWQLEVAGDLDVDGNAALGGTTTITGAVTMLSTLEVSGTITGDLNGGIQETGSAGAILEVRVLSIGDWNMDSTTNKYLNSPVASIQKIRQVEVLIVNDAESSFQKIDYSDGGSVTIDISGDRIHLARVASGFFDSGSYSTTSFNRGWVTIWYEE
jgi:hypothetical protein